MRTLIERGALKPGDRLPAERDLALHVGVSRPTVRAGLRALAAMGVVQARHGSGTFIPSGPPTLGNEPLSFLAALHGITHEEMYEARRILEVEAAALAAERATDDQLARSTKKWTNMFDALDEAQVFLVHDINFHRVVAIASGNPIVASLVDMVSSMFYEKRRETAERATDRNLRDAADMHRRIYLAIRDRERRRRAGCDESTPAAIERLYRTGTRHRGPRRDAETRGAGESSVASGRLGGSGVAICRRACHPNRATARSSSPIFDPTFRLGLQIPMLATAHRTIDAVGHDW